MPHKSTGLSTRTVTVPLALSWSARDEGTMLRVAAPGCGVADGCRVAVGVRDGWVVVGDPVVGGTPCPTTRVPFWEVEVICVPPEAARITDVKFKGDCPNASPLSVIWSRVPL